MPWFGYSPQDKIFRNGEPLSSFVIIKMLESAAIDKFITLDIHSKIVLDYFDREIVNISVDKLFADYISGNFAVDDDWCIVSLDKGSRKRAKSLAEKIGGLEVIEFDKERDRDTGDIRFISVKGKVKNRKVIAFDDFTSTGSTLIKSCKHLKVLGAEDYICCITHIVVNETIEKIQKSNIDKLITTNSINIPILDSYSKVSVLDVSQILANQIAED
jgi:ribose-phosphate pyrophosphokinase